MKLEDGIFRRGKPVSTVSLNRNEETNIFVSSFKTARPVWRWRVLSRRFMMKKGTCMRTYFSLIAILMITATLIGCDEDDPVQVSNTAPVACFSMSEVLSADARTVYDLNFIVDPSCSADEETAGQYLEARWDFENDGTWDTEFGPLEIDYAPKPDPTATEWTARLDIRDPEGLVATATQTIPIGPYPLEPDIIAGTLCIERFSSPDSCYTTVQAGEDFNIVVYANFLGDFRDPAYREVITLDGEIFSDKLRQAYSNDLFAGVGDGFGPNSIAEPGEYEMVLYLDYDNVYPETDESNNTFTLTLTVTP
jgi:hypothetical protein